MSENTLTVKPGRLVSLDIFRGMTIASMLLVNNAGDWDHVFSPLEHAEWNGCTATDLIFPFFLFIMGVAMPFSLGRRLEQGARPASLLGPAAWRACMLFALGLFLNFLMCSALEKPLRIMGVLQRLGICYFAATLIMFWGRERAQILWIGILLVGYYLVMMLVPVPGRAAGNLTQLGNLASWIDTKIFGSHCYEWDKNTGRGHDPEGLLSTLPALASTLIGCLTGEWLRRPGRNGYEKVSGMFVAGVILVILGKAWELTFPMNKNIWTSSYVLFTGGWSLLGVGSLYWLVDLKGRTAGMKPFIVYGMNPIAAYVGASSMAYVSIWIKWAGPDGKPLRLKTWVYAHFYQSWIPQLAGPYISSAAYGMTYVILWCGIMWILYRRKIFLKV